MKDFTGTGVALVTPFDDRQQVDFSSLRQLVAHVIQGGADFLVALGTTAESATLTAQEKAKVVEIIAAENRNRVPIMAGIGGNNTQEVLQAFRTTPWLHHCQGILSITPYYNKPSQEGLYQHFKAIAAHAPLPVCVYNVPGRTGVNMQGATTARLSQDCPQLLGVKEASGNIDQATEILKLKRSDFKALSGDDSLVLPLMALGFEGVISVTANAFPAACSTLVNSMQTGDWATARRLHLLLADLNKALFEEGNPAGIKAVLHALGIIRHNTLRLPLTPVSERLQQKIAVLLQNIQA